MSSDEEYIYDDEDGFGQDMEDLGRSAKQSHILDIMLIPQESESEPDVYDVLSPSIEGMARRYELWLS